MLVCGDECKGGGVFLNTWHLVCSTFALLGVGSLSLSVREFNQVHVVHRLPPGLQRIRVGVCG